MFLRLHSRMHLTACNQISPGKGANFLSIYLSDLRYHASDSFGLRFVWQTHPHDIASSASCSSGQRFTAGFLQIPPHGGHPCLKLALPTIKARSGLTPYSLRPCRAHHEKSPTITRRAFHWVFS